jgi:hypothetical protein
VVVDAEVPKKQRRPLFGVNEEVRSKKYLTEPTLLGISDFVVNQDLTDRGSVLALF